MSYLRDVLGKDLMRTVYLNALMLESDNYFSNPNRNLYKIIHSFVEEGIGSGEFKNELDSQELTLLITRCMRGSLYDWFIFGDNFNLIGESQKFIVIVLDGIKRRQLGNGSIV